MFNHDNLQAVQTLFGGIYIGVVEKNNDVTRPGQVQVRVFGLHTSKKTKDKIEGIPTTELPWAIPGGPIQGGSVSGQGWSGVPQQGSHVLVCFIGGDHNYPIYFASVGGQYKTLPDSELGFSDPAGVYPTGTGHDFHFAGRGTPVNHGTPVGPEPANPSEPVYPKNLVLANEHIIVEHDTTPHKERWSITHVGDSGISYLEIQPDGSVVRKAQGSAYEVTVGDAYVHVGAKETKTVVGDSTETVQGKMTINVSGGDTIVNCTNGNILLKGAGDVDLGGIITDKCKCHFTGNNHGDKSTVVKATK